MTTTGGGQDEANGGVPGRQGSSPAVRHAEPVGRERSLGVAPRPGLGQARGRAARRRRAAGGARGPGADRQPGRDARAAARLEPRLRAVDGLGRGQRGARDPVEVPHRRARLPSAAAQPGERRAHRAVGAHRQRLRRGVGAHDAPGVPRARRAQARGPGAGRRRGRRGAQERQPAGAHGRLQRRPAQRRDPLAVGPDDAERAARLLPGRVGHDSPQRARLHLGARQPLPRAHALAARRSAPRLRLRDAHASRSARHGPRGAADLRDADGHGGRRASLRLGSLRRPRRGAVPRRGSGRGAAATYSPLPASSGS